MIKALILDFGGTIVSIESNAASLRTVADELGVPVDNVMHEIMGHPDWPDAMMGKWTIEEFDQRLYQRLNRPYDSDRWPAIYRLFADETLSTGLLDLSADVRASGRQVIVLSNATFDLEERVLDSKYGILDRFDFVVNSSRLGMIKPDPAIYHHTLDRLGVEAHEAIFVDDLPENVVAARELGIHAIQFQSDAQATADVRHILVQNGGWGGVRV